MLKKNTGIFQILITLAMVFSAFISKYNTLILLASIFFISTLVSYSICNFSLIKAVCMSGCAVIFYTVTSFVKHSLAPNDAITLCMLFLPGLVIGISFRAKLSFRDTFFLAVVIDSLILIGLFAVSKYFYKLDITAQIRNTFLADFDDKLNLLKSLSPEVFEQIKSNEHQIFNALYILMPGLIPFASALFFVFFFLVQYGISKLACMEYIIRSNSFNDGFDTFRPGIVTNITMILMFITIMYETSQKVVMVCINLALFIMMMYFITTLSFIEHKLKQRGLYPGKRFGIMIAVIVLTIVFSVIVPVVNFVFIFVFFGFLDSLFDFRKLKIKKVD